MEKEYRIKCTPPEGPQLTKVLHRLPSPISRPEMREIYNYCVEDDEIYFVDRGVDAEVSSKAFKLFIDAALEKSASIEIRKV